MKKLLLSGVAIAALAAISSANAADLGQRPVYKAPPVVAPVPVFTWTGCYIGAHGGFGWGRDHNDFGVAVASGGTEGGEPGFFPQEFGPFNHNTSGGVAGGQVGCNYQFAANWVVGVEGEPGGLGSREALPPQRMKPTLERSRALNPTTVGTVMSHCVSGTRGVGVCCTAKSVVRGVISGTRSGTTTFPPIIHAPVGEPAA